MDRWMTTISKLNACSYVNIANKNNNKYQLGMSSSRALLVGARIAVDVVFIVDIFGRRSLLNVDEINHKLS